MVFEGIRGIDIPIAEMHSFLYLISDISSKMHLQILVVMYASPLTYMAYSLSDTLIYFSFNYGVLYKILLRDTEYIDPNNYVKVSMLYWLLFS